MPKVGEGSWDGECQCQKKNNVIETLQECRKFLSEIWVVWSEFGRIDRVL